MHAEYLHLVFDSFNPFDWFPTGGFTAQSIFMP